ncbi:MAG: putative S-adenosylmethionine-dependent methyltransferase [Chromatiales bacterium USCg_Taylor]|nr:MAG: putative S-adenosylmethionine-dependent methyltransferase [Chromatiales bacterium USCg_Taylor]
MQDIKAALGGLARVQAMDVADDNHHYIVLSQLYAWMHAHALPAAQGVALDIEFTPECSLPLTDGSVDTVLSTQVLEHVPNADFYISECARLLKTDGVLILTAPTQWRHHEVPFDYLRFIRYGLTALLQRHGFAIDKFAQTGGVYSLLGQIFLNHLAERGVQRKRLFRLINRAALWLYRKYPDSEDTINWMGVAVKKEIES